MKKYLYLTFLLSFILLIAFVLLIAQEKTKIVLYNPDLVFGNIETFTASISTYLEATNKTNQTQLSLEYFRKTDDLEKYTNEQSPSFAIFNSWYYINNKKDFNAIPLLIASKNNSPYYQKIIVVHKDSNIKQLKDLTGKTLALASSSEQDYPYLDKVIFKGQINSEKSLMIMPVSKDIDALLALVMRQVDAALVTPESYELLRKTSPAYVENIESFYTSPNIPLPVLCTLKSNVSQDVIKETKNAFLTMKDASLGQKTLKFMQIDEWIPFSNNYLQGLPKNQGSIHNIEDEYIIQSTFDYNKILSDWILPKSAYAEEENNEDLPNICILKTQNLTRYNTVIDNFQNMLKANYQIFSLEGEIEKAEEIIPLMKASKPDLILALGTKSAMIVKQNFTETPIVFAMVVGYPSVLAPNVTGITMKVPLETQLSSLKFIIPSINKIGIIYNPNTSKEFVEQLIIAADKLEIEIITKTVHSSDEVGSAFDDISEKIDALWMIPDLTVLENFNLLVDKTQEKNIPYIALSSAFVRSGALLSIAPNDESIGNQASIIAKQIIRGKRISELPVAMPIGTLTTLNLITAENIELTISPEKLIFVNEIIK